MSKLTFDFSTTEIGLGKEWSADFGVRLLNTKTKSEGYDQSIERIENNPNDPTELILSYAEAFRVTEKNSSRYWLPSFNFKLDLCKEHLVKLGISRTISRPSLNRLAPAVGEYTTRVGASSAVAGNPHLKPYDATNFDLGWSWIFDDADFLALTFFLQTDRSFYSAVG